MKPLYQIVKMRHGSHLYGTNTATSDEDFKGVHLPSARGILLGRHEGVISEYTTPQDQKNKPGDVDYQSYALAKYLEMVRVGDTTATEMLFAPESALVHVTPWWHTVVANRPYIISRECRGFVHYARQQATKYCVKGDRLDVAVRITELLQQASDQNGGTAKLSAIRGQLEDFIAHSKYAAFVDMPCPNNASGTIEHFECLDRKMPMTARVMDALKLYAGVRDGYGKRAQAAYTSQGVDWKAISHAHRITGQAAELLSTGVITLPLPNAEYIREIKLGLHPYDKVQDELEQMIGSLDDLALTSPLPEKANVEIIEDLIISAHETQLGIYK